MSFAEYLDFFAEAPLRHSRSAIEYCVDAIDYFGSYEIDGPLGKQTRYAIFDLAWLSTEQDGVPLVGQEDVQDALVRHLRNAKREGRSVRMPLLHGPNGSAKSTLIDCLRRGIEHYASLEEGALYRFQWVFPRREPGRGVVGFMNTGESSSATESYAHLSDEQIEVRFRSELRDHPLFLLPEAERKAFLEHLGCDTAPLSDWFLNGDLCSKNRKLFDALLQANAGDATRVLRHVQVVRYFISARYRCGAATIAPQMSVDASERQQTMDRTIGTLPSALHSLNLFDVYGDWVDAYGGILEFSDLLKRPLEAIKYLQHTIETGRINLQTQDFQTNSLALASANDVQLNALKKHHEYESFRGRINPIRVSYLLSYLKELSIYQRLGNEGGWSTHDPHALTLAARFAVLTRLKPINEDVLPDNLKECAGTISPVEKLELYSLGSTPSRLTVTQSQGLLSHLAILLRDGAEAEDYEGGVGASPREIRQLLMDAVSSGNRGYLSAFSVFKELESLCRREEEYLWLQLEPLEQGFRSPKLMLDELYEWLLMQFEEHFRIASGLVEMSNSGEWFSRYLEQVALWVKGEKRKNAHSGADEDPDETLMAEVEALAGRTENFGDFRNWVVTKVGGWSLANPGEAIQPWIVFGEVLKQIQDRRFEALSERLETLCSDVLLVASDEATWPAEERRRHEAEAVITRLEQQFAYRRDMLVEYCDAYLKERSGGS